MTAAASGPLGETAALLRLTQRLSPGFPVGGYAYSHGLETAMASGAVASAGDLSDWIATIVATGSGRQDAILLCQAMRAGADLDRLDAMARALAPGRERLVEATDQGRAFLALTRTLSAVRGRGPDGGGTANDMGPDPGRDLTYPVAVGADAAGLGLAPGLVAALYLQAFAANLVQAGVRFLPLGQTEGQAVLAGLHPLIGQVAAAAAAAGLEDLGGAALRADLASLRHETLEVRIYRT